MMENTESDITNNKLLKQLVRSIKDEGEHKSEAEERTKV